MREVDPDNPPYATNVITMHVDTFIRIIRGGLDFRTAYLYDLIEIASNDGLPPAYHLRAEASLSKKALHISRW